MPLLLILVQTVNNQMICDSIAQLLDHCLLYTPDDAAIEKFLSHNPNERLHAIRPKCSMHQGRDHFDRFEPTFMKFRFLKFTLWHQQFPPICNVSGCGGLKNPETPNIMYFACQ